MHSSRPSSPLAEVHITPRLIRSLLEDQHPDLADLRLTFQESGWDNMMVRLGDRLALRLPRRKHADAFILKEQSLLPQIAQSIPIRVPVPVRTGLPTLTYPFHWSVTEWLPGKAADISRLNSTEMPRLISILRTLHAMQAPPSLPNNPMRDCALSEKINDIGPWVKYLEEQTDYISPEVLNAWDVACQTPIDVPLSLIMGDMHARNILVESGHLSGIIDWGDMCWGDPAVDLISIWALFGNADIRQAALKAYGASKQTIDRAKGWAIFFGIILAGSGLEDTPRHAVMGRDMLRRIKQDC